MAEAMNGSILLIRHAHPEAPVDPSFTSHWTDTNLSERGRREAACLAERLERELAGRTCKVITSDLKRASQTAEAVCGRLKLGEPRRTRDLREFNGGVGGTLDAIRESARVAALASLNDPSEAQGETWAAFYNRVARGMEEVLSDHSELSLVFSHYGTTINAVNWWVGTGLNAAGDVPVGFGATLTSIAVLQMNKHGKRVLERLNDSSHLYAAGIGPPLLAER